MNKATVKNYISTQLGTEAPITITPLKGGASNLTFRVTAGEQHLILRTSPPGTKAKGAHNMEREFQWLKALKPSYDLCPEPLFLCQDSSVFERDFYAMQPIEGLIIRQNLPEAFNPTQAPDLCRSLITNHFQLHQCDGQGLHHFDKGRGYIKRQIDGWITRYLKVRPAHDKAQKVMDWLEKNMPEDNRDYCPIHNDFKFDNVVFDSSKTEKPQIIGVLDWELATVGDPLMDLGCSLAYWIQSDDNDMLKQCAMMPTHLPEMMSRDELVHYYCDLAGIQLDDYRFYYVYGLFRLAVIAQQIFFRYENGQNPNPAFATLGAIRDLMIQQATQQLK
ncbi:phosphotransferase family protein [Marinicella rhabdoformis]|uniref:phosphotransferase family protein n=1 Tax=Marinicella rhabdoformis TaxID=2580566 RepID=UPI0012AEBBC9|nr:phosphotransferase family protein [Marinicella rhabdoformis]